MRLAANDKTPCLWSRRGFRWAVAFLAVGMVVVLLGFANYYAGQAAFDFRLSNSGSYSNAGGIKVLQGSSGTLQVTVSLVKGLAHVITLSCSGASRPLPAGVSCDFIPVSGYPPLNATLTLTTTLQTPGGYYTIEAIGTAGGLTRVTLFTLIVA